MQRAGGESTTRRGKTPRPRPTANEAKIVRVSAGGVRAMESHGM